MDTLALEKLNLEKYKAETERRAQDISIKKAKIDSMNSSDRAMQICIVTVVICIFLFLLSWVAIAHVQGYYKAQIAAEQKIQSEKIEFETFKVKLEHGYEQVISPTSYQTIWKKISLGSLADSVQ